MIHIHFNDLKYILRKAFDAAAQGGKVCFKLNFESYITCRTIFSFSHTSPIPSYGDKKSNSQTA